MGAGTGRRPRKEVGHAPFAPRHARPGPSWSLRRAQLVVMVVALGRKTSYAG